MFDITQILTTVFIVAVPLFAGIILHEVSHGYAAFRFGDPTARNAGRLSLNPVRHVDPMGTLILPALLLLMKSPFLFGWAKPVPINPAYFEDPRKGIFWVSLAGPAANFALATAFYMSFLVFKPSLDTLLGVFIWYGVFINLVLGVLNLLPIPPLDGSKILATFLPGRLAGQFMQLERYGFIILILLIFMGALGWIFGHVRYFTLYLFS
jgi:Zn-dependent protease